MQKSYTQLQILLTVAIASSAAVADPAIPVHPNCIGQQQETRQMKDEIARSIQEHKELQQKFQELKKELTRGLQEHGEEDEVIRAILKEIDLNQIATPRKAFVATPKTAVEARYLEGWKKRVSRTGNQHFPTDTNGKRLYGSLILTVGIQANGALADAIIDCSSGNPYLDEAALKITKLAAPFAPLPTGIVDLLGKKADFLYITRTWTFSRDGTKH